MAEPVADQLVGKKWAYALMATMLVGFALATAFMFYDRAHLASLEQISQPTAVGDHAYFPLKSDADPAKSIATFAGRPLFAADRMRHRDSEMIKAGMDDSRSFFIYKVVARATAKPGDSYFVKLRDGEYLKLRDAGTAASQ
ncbi:MAG: hypothetical protein M3O82_05725 [Verrucomicrobiota bacterium]|nr:hypothetical protein [Verrucomicrobiota bacterium]